MFDAVVLAQFGGGPGGAEIGVVCVIVIGMLIAVAIYALILRGAVSLFNKLAGRNAPSPYDSPSSQFGPPPSQFGSAPSQYGQPPAPPPAFGRQSAGPPLPSDNPYAASTGVAGPTAAAQSGSIIPEPSFGKAFGIALLREVINAAIGFVIGFMLAVVAAPAAPVQGGGLMDVVTGGLPSLIFGVIINIFLGSAILMWLLPTTYGRALLISLLELLIRIVIVVLVVGAVIGFMAALGP